jgi:GT2 family glycosyltransferase/peptidoglycan/xylan/chitin deacetylase (PgdA/CDA1 family)
MEDQARRPRFSVVIPTYERRDTVCRSVAALDRQTFPDFEVVVAVDGSRDGTAEALRDLRTSFPLEVVEQPNQGRAAAVNAGAAAARGELILFLDDDMSADPALLAEHDRSHREGADVVMGDLPLDLSSPSNLLSWGVGWWARARCERLSAPGAEIGIADLLTGQMSISREAFAAVGRFDVSFTRDGLFGGEDLDLGYRLLKAGYSLVFNPRAISYQHYDVDPADYLKRAHEAGRSDWELVAKHPELSERLQGSPRFTTRRSRLLLTPFLLAPAALSAPLRAGAAAIVRSGRNTARLRRLFFAVRTLEYLRGKRVAERGVSGRSAIVLAYHSLSDLSQDPILREYGIRGEVLADQLDALSARGHEFIDLDLLLAALAGEAPLPERATLVTFDDAYADLLPTAVEVLSRRGIPGIVFAVSGQIGGSNEWDRHLGAAELPLLDAEGLQALRAARMEIGSHTVSHPQLTKVPAETVEAELHGSAVEIEQVGLPRPRAFAYPHGEWNPSIARAAATAGYDVAFTIDPGRVEPGSDRWALPRIEVLAGDSTRYLRLKLATAGWPPRLRDLILKAARRFL